MPAGFERAQGSGLVRIELPAPQADRNLPAPAGKGLPGIGAQVHQHLLHLGGIGHHLQAAGQVHMQAHTRRHGIGQQVVGIAVPVHHQHLVIAVGERGFGGGHHLVRHPLARGLPFEAVG